MKKQYIQPAFRIHKFKTPTILEGSPIAPGISKDENNSDIIYANGDGNTDAEDVY